MSERRSSWEGYCHTKSSQTRDERTHFRIKSYKQYQLFQPSKRRLVDSADIRTELCPVSERLKSMCMREDYSLLENYE